MSINPQYLQLAKNKINKQKSDAILWTVFGLGCYYSFERSIILTGSVGYDLKLNIVDCKTYSKCCFDDFANTILEALNTLKSNLKRNEALHRNYNIAVNNDLSLIDSLKISHKACDFKSNENELSSTENLIKSLNYKNRIIFPDNFDIGYPPNKQALLLIGALFRERLANKVRHCDRNLISYGQMYYYKIQRLSGDPDCWDSPPRSYTLGYGNDVV
jgi:hypothetical protein